MSVALSTMSISLALHEHMSADGSDHTSVARVVHKRLQVPGFGHITSSAPLYAYSDCHGRTVVVLSEEAQNPYTGVWAIPPTTLYTPDEVGLSPVQVSQYLRDRSEQGPLEEYLIIIEYGHLTAPMFCALCEEDGRMCSFCGNESRTQIEEIIQTRMKLAGIDARIGSICRAAALALPAAQARRYPRSSGPLTPPADADAGADAGAGAYAGIDHLLLPLPLFPSPEKDLDAFIDEIMAL